MDDVINRQVTIAQPKNTCENTCEVARTANDCISRQAAIATACSGLVRRMEDGDWRRVADIREDLTALPPTQPEPQWIPVKTRPMTEGERQYWEEHTGVKLEAEDAVFFDCQMPDDGQEVWVCYKSGTVSEDVCEMDDFYGLEENGDWLDIVAWMPRIKPEPYKGGI